MSEKSLLKFQIGPVQEFIAAARSTRDLWSGSYLLSWLVATGIKIVPDYMDQLIFPNPTAQPLLTQGSDSNADGILIPNLPNLFVACVPTEGARELAIQIEIGIRNEWKKIAQSVWRAAVERLGVAEDKKDVFERDVNHHLSVSWLITPLQGGDYARTYRRNGKLLAAIRQTRDFRALGGGRVRTGIEKDSLTGKEEAICGGSDFQRAMQNKDDEIAALFKHGDQIGAITLIKRIWHLTYLDEQLPSGSKRFNIRSIPAIASRQDKHDDHRSASEAGDGDKYIAAIAFDGDSIGKWINAEWCGEGAELESHHRQFSRALSDFALNRAKTIVEGTPDQLVNGIWSGQLIYAGGDDVVALVPADQAIQIASELRKAFRDATKEIRDQEGQSPDASAGIAIAHIHSPLQDLVREAQKAEKRAKNVIGRPAFSVTLLKRSGEITHWGSKWESGGLALYEAVAQMLESQDLSAKFPHRVCQLLQPYRTHLTGLSVQLDSITEDALARKLLKMEFCHAAERQGSKQASDALGLLLDDYLEGIAAQFKAMNTATGDGGRCSSQSSLLQDMLTSLIGLFTTVSFAIRSQPGTVATAEKQNPVFA